MAGDAEPARMGDPLAVADQQIGAAPQHIKRGQHRRPFAEREKARHVGKQRRPIRDGVVERLERREGQHDNHGSGLHFTFGAPRVALITSVYSGDGLHFAEIVCGKHSRAQSLLDRQRFLESCRPIGHTAAVNLTS
jgi:hypothetical protein